jgi:NADH dehydrogenase/NADH:ubiquinone oxidoreductase subunit G
MINLTINGKQIEVEDGTTVLNAARQNDIKILRRAIIRTLPYGGCRLCVVEVKGMRVPTHPAHYPHQWYGH